MERTIAVGAAQILRVPSSPSFKRRLPAAALSSPVHKRCDLPHGYATLRAGADAWHRQSAMLAFLPLNLLSPILLAHDDV